MVAAYPSSGTGGVGAGSGGPTGGIGAGRALSFGDGVVAETGGVDRR